jgi:hypothetical protein
MQQSAKPEMQNARMQNASGLFVHSRLFAFVHSYRGCICILPMTSGVVFQRSD